MLLRLRNDVDRALHRWVDATGVVERANRVEAVAIGCAWAEHPGAAHLRHHVTLTGTAAGPANLVIGDVVVGPGDFGATLDSERRRDEAVVHAADSHRDFCFIELFVLVDRCRLRHYVVRVVVRSGLNGGPLTIVREERIWKVIDVVLPADSVECLSELLSANMAQEATLINHVDAWIGRDFDHLATWTIGHVAAKWNGGELAIWNLFDRREITVPGEVGPFIWENEALTISAEVIHGRTGAFDEIA